MNPVDPITAQVAREEPGKQPKRQSRWLDLQRLREEIYRITLRQVYDKRTLKRLQRTDPHGYGTVLAGEAVNYNANQLTLLCAIRALHRNRKHVVRQRVFGPGYPNGTAVVNKPVRIPSELLRRFLVGV